MKAIKFRRYNLSPNHRNPSHRDLNYKKRGWGKGPEGSDARVDMLVDGHNWAATGITCPSAH